MYARLGNNCPFNMSNTYKNFLTLNDLQHGYGHNMLTDDRKYLSTLPQSKCGDNEVLKTYIESPFPKPIRVPEQTKLDQSALSTYAR